MTERTRAARIVRTDLMYFLGQSVILTNLILLTIVWVVCIFTYYLCNLMIKYIPGDFQYNTLFMFSADIFAALSSRLLLTFFTPKKLFSTYFFLSGLAGACLVLLVDKENPNFMVPIFVALARIGIISSTVTIYMTHPSYFPTLFAVTSMGVTNIITRVIVIFAPMAAELDFPTPMIILAALSFVASISSLFINDDVRRAD